MYSTMNDRFYMDPVLTDPQLRKNHFEELQKETRANDAQVLKTNVRIGSYSGWKPKIVSSNTASKAKLPPKSSQNNMSKNMSSQDIVFTPQQSLIGKMQSCAPNASNNVDGSGLIWNESTDMFKTTKQQFLEEPLAKVNFSDFVPEIEEKRNKKNESCLNFAHRIDLKILRSIEQSPSMQSKMDKNVFKRKKTASNNPLSKDQVYTMSQF